VLIFLTCSPMYTMTLGVGRFCPEGGNGEFSTGCQKDFFGEQRAVKLILPIRN